MANLEGFVSQAALDAAKANNDPRLNANNSQVVSVQTGQPTTNPLIVTGTNPANQFNQDSQALNNALATIGQGNQITNQITGSSALNADKSNSELAQVYSDPYTQMLDKIAAKSDKATQNLIATIKANKYSRESNVNQEYDRLKQGLFSLGLSTDKLQYTPDLVYGSIMQAENQRTAQLQQLDQQEATALLEAQQARENKDFTLLKEKMAYIKDIKNQRLETLKNSFDTMNYEAKIGEIQAKQVYDQLQKIPPAKRTEFLQAIATKLNIPLAAITSQVAEIQRTRAKGTKKSSTNTTGSTVKLTPSKGISLLTPKFEANKGEDGYVDPTEWTKARTLWMSQGLSKSTFDNNFKQYLNPESYSLAGFPVKK